MGYRLDTDYYENFSQYISNIISELKKVEFGNKKIVKAKSIFEMITNEIIDNLKEIKQRWLFRPTKRCWIDSNNNFVLNGEHIPLLQFSEYLAKNIHRCLHNDIIDVKDLDCTFNDKKYRFTINDDVDQFYVTFEIDGEAILIARIPSKIYWDYGSEEKNVILRSWTVRITFPEIIRLSDKFFSIPLQTVYDKSIFVEDGDDEMWEYSDDDENDDDNDINFEDNDDEICSKKKRLSLGFIDEEDIEQPPLKKLSKALKERQEERRKEFADKENENKEQKNDDSFFWVEENKNKDQELDENDINELVEEFKLKGEADERLKMAQHMRQEREEDFNLKYQKMKNLKRELWDRIERVCSSYVNNEIKDETMDDLKRELIGEIKRICSSYMEKEIEEITINIKYK